MQEIFKFFQQYWQVVLGAILFVVSLIIAIIRKKPFVDIYSHLYACCLAAVNIAEKTAFKGSDKLDFALGIVYKFLEDVFPNVKGSQYEHTIKVIIEQILTTPQKKGE